jgi:hypothetical protein
MDYEDYMNIINRVRDGGLSHLYAIINNTCTKSNPRDQCDEKSKRTPLFLPYIYTVHCKKRFAIFPSPAGMSLTKLSLVGNIPAQGEFSQ